MGNDDECKVDIITDQYDLDDLEVQYSSMDDHLYARWTGEDSRQAIGYRTLTEWFNKRVLKRVYDRHGRKSSESRLDNDYEILAGDDELLREDLKDDLKADGINANRLVRSFVSWGTIRNHLQNCIDGDKGTTEAKTDWEGQSVDIATDIAEQKVEQALKSLTSKGILDRGDEAEIAVQVQLSCPECHTRVPFEDARERGFICKEHRK